jgi:hypothetical protein
MFLYLVCRFIFLIDKKLPRFNQSSAYYICYIFISLKTNKRDFVRFQVLTAASMMFRAVFWVILPCKMIVDPEDSSEHRIKETSLLIGEPGSSVSIVS